MDTPRSTAARPRHTQPRDGERGFALIGFVVLIIGVAAAIILAMYANKAAELAARQTRTMAEMQRVVDALVAYASATGRLPCPARGAALDGREQTCANATQSVGVVPWTTLGLQQEDANDKWGRTISYRVMTVPGQSITPDAGVTPTTPTDIAVCRSGTCTDRVDNLAFVLVSGGPNGAGSFLGSQPYGAAAGLRERDNLSAPSGNAAGPTRYYDMAANVVRAADGTIDASDPATFDDVVAWMTLADLIKIAGFGGNSEREEIPAQTFSKDHMDAFGTNYADSGANKQQPVNVVNDQGEDNNEINIDFNPNGNAPGYRACYWYTTDLRLKGSTARFYFEFATARDLSGTAYGHGFVFAMPWGRMPTTYTNGSNRNNECGGGDMFLGFADPKSNGGATKTELPSGPRLGVEVDLHHSIAVTRKNQAAPEDIVDPFTAGNYTSGYNHIAILSQNNDHTGTTSADGPRCSLTFPQQADRGNGTDYNATPGYGAPGQACAYDAANRTWLEDGETQWHKMRVEVHAEADNGCGTGTTHPDDPLRVIRSGSSPAGFVRVDVWHWEPTEDCAANCQIVKQDYKDVQATAAADAASRGQTFTPDDLLASYCVPYASAVSGLDKIRSGFTFGMGDGVSGATHIRGFRGDASVKDPLPAVPNGSGTITITPALVAPQLNGLGETYRSPRGADRTTTTWLSGLAISGRSVEIAAERGNIVVDATSPEGFGVDGSPGGDNAGSDNDGWTGLTVERATAQREALAFSVANTYNTAAIVLTGFDSADVLTLEGRRADGVTGTRSQIGPRLTLKGTKCAATGRVVVPNVSFGARFDTVVVRSALQGGGVSSEFKVAAVKMCADATTCTSPDATAAACTLEAVP